MGISISASNTASFLGDAGRAFCTHLTAFPVACVVRYGETSESDA